MQRRTGSPLANKARKLHKQLATFSQEASKQYPVGSRVIFTERVDGQEIHLGGRVAPSQFRGEEALIRGLRVEVDDRDWRKIPVERCFRPNREIHVSWVQLQEPQP